MVRLKVFVSLAFVIAIAFAPAVALSPAAALVGVVWMATLMAINAISMRISGAILKRRMIAMGLDYALMGEFAREAGYHGHIFVIMACVISVIGIVVAAKRQHRLSVGWLLASIIAFTAMCVMLY